jgi:hypothetical protein
MPHRPLCGLAARPALTLLCAVAALLAIGGGTACAQGNIVTYDYTGQSGNQATTPASSVAAGLTASDIARSSDLVPDSQAGTMSATNWPTTATLANINLGSYTFTLTPTEGFVLNLSQLQIPLLRTGAGPGQVAVRSSLDNFATNIAAPFTPPTGSSPSTYTVDLTAPGFQNLTSPITFHVYGYNANNSVGSLRFYPSTVVTGTVTPVPEPALALSAAAVAAGLAGLYRRARRAPCAP